MASASGLDALMLWHRGGQRKAAYTTIASHPAGFLTGERCVQIHVVLPQLNSPPTQCGRMKRIQMSVGERQLGCGALGRGGSLARKKGQGKGYEAQGTAEVAVHSR
jgi:hypothetical protein